MSKKITQKYENEMFSLFRMSHKPYNITEEQVGIIK